MAEFDLAYGETQLKEGGFVNDPVDRGGETFCGVSRRFHPNWPGWKIVDQIKQDQPDDFVKRINENNQLAELSQELYREKYWQPIRGDEISDQHVANKLFDSGVHLGVTKSVRILQESLNLLNRNQDDYPDLQLDGQIGIATLSTLQGFLKLEKGRPDYLLKLLNLMQAQHYLEIMRRDPTQERFARGWLNRVGLR